MRRRELTVPTVLKFSSAGCKWWSESNLQLSNLLSPSALKKHKLTGDTSVMTYRGHGVLHTLIRCRFSPEFSTGQRFIYSGCSTGKIVSECLRALRPRVCRQ